MSELQWFNFCQHKNVVAKIDGKFYVDTRLDWCAFEVIKRFLKEGKLKASAPVTQEVTE